MGTNGDCLYADVNADKGFGVDFEKETLNVCITLKVSDSL